MEPFSKPLGTKVRVTPSVAKVTVPATEGESVIALFDTEVGSIWVLMTATTEAFSGTPVAPETGLQVTTVGEVVTAAVPVVKEDE